MERENINRTLKIAVEENGSKMMVRFSAGFTGIFIFLQNIWTSRKRNRFGFRYVRCEAVKSISNEGFQEAM